MRVGTPYLRAIELHIKDAFPERKVSVFCEESPFFPTKCAVKAYVDRYGACITLDAYEGVIERSVSEKLISMIKEGMRREANGYCEMERS